ncbi:hypothetical protein [Deinococcus roseus]|uniref:Uncharacterized protein n=1 Tax=Deinococcus roseus TaxID=392414 RepID=A0ABQ2DFB9_9DEIO|nr:hypothetical protein [Deinococcus roseus]GGJ54822.1 hypothetical protein GCM10008938_46100 [Deinococcus roseus]
MSEFEGWSSSQQENAGFKKFTASTSPSHLEGTRASDLISLFNWKSVQAWAELKLHEPHPEHQRALLQDIVQMCNGEPESLNAEWSEPPAPRPVLDWLLLSDEELLAQVRYSLHHPPRLEQDHLAVLPACAMVACREYHLPLAADVLRLMLYLNLQTPVVREVAEFLAFQQKPDGSCGFINPLKPTPFEAGQGFAEFHLPATHAIVRALQAHRAQHARTEDRPWTFELNT